MDMYEFGNKCRALNGQYKELFGYIPAQSDYACTREEFLEALCNSIETKKEISFFLIKNLSEEELTNGNSN